MDNELTYSVMNQDVAWGKEKDRKRRRVKYEYKQSFGSRARSDEPQFRFGRNIWWTVNGPQVAAADLRKVERLSGSGRWSVDQQCFLGPSGFGRAFRCGSFGAVVRSGNCSFQGSSAAVRWYRGAGVGNWSVDQLCLSVPWQIWTSSTHQSD